MIRLSDYKQLKPGDLVYPAFGASRDPDDGMMIIRGRGTPYAPHLVLGIKPNALSRRATNCQGMIFVIADDCSIGWFSSEAVLFV